jgi:hypothetical protein
VTNRDGCTSTSILVTASLIASQCRLLVCTAQHHAANSCDCTVHVNEARHRHSVHTLHHGLSTTNAAKQRVAVTVCLIALWCLHITYLHSRMPAIYTYLYCIAPFRILLFQASIILRSDHRILSNPPSKNRKFNIIVQREHGFPKQRLVPAQTIPF